MTQEQIEEELRKIKRRTRGEPVRNLEEIMKLLERLKEEKSDEVG